MITAGGAGVVVTDDATVAHRIRHLSTQAREPGGEYIHDAVGFNFRLTNLCAAVGVAQMERLPEALARKARIATAYRSAFAGLPGLACMPSATWATPTHWLFTIRLTSPMAGAPETLLAELAANGIEARRLWRPLHMLPIYRKELAYRVKVAEMLYASAVSLPSSIGLSVSEQERVIRVVKGCVSMDRDARGRRQ